MNRRSLYQWSTIILASMLLSLCFPVLSYAASFIKVVYDSGSGSITGTIQSDQPTVHLSMDSGNTNIDLSSVVGQAYTVENSDSYYYNVTGNIGSGFNPYRLLVTDNVQSEVTPLVTSSLYTFNNAPLPAPASLSISGISINDRVGLLALFWTKVEDPNVKGYNIYEDNVFIKFASKDDIFASLYGVDLDITHEYAVATVNWAGVESASRTIASGRIGSAFDLFNPVFNYKPKGSYLQKGDELFSFRLLQASDGSIPEHFGRSELSFSLSDVTGSEEPMQRISGLTVEPGGMSATNDEIDPPGGIFIPGQPNFPGGSPGNSGPVIASDFEVVASDGSIIPVSTVYVTAYTNPMDSVKYNIYAFHFNEFLSTTQTYTLRMSQTSAGEEIRIPDVYSTQGQLHAAFYGYRNNDVYHFKYDNWQLVYGDIYPPAQPEGLKITPGDAQAQVGWEANNESDLAGYRVYLEGVLLTSSPIAATSYNLTGLINGKTYKVGLSAVDKAGNESPKASMDVIPLSTNNGNGGNNGGGGGGIVITPPPVVESKPAPCAAIADNTNKESGTLDISMGTQDKQKLLPACASDLSSNNTLTFRNGDLNATIPGSLLEKLKSLITAKELEDAQISFISDKVNQETAEKMLVNAQKRLKNTGLQSAGDFYNFDLSIITKDGKEQRLSKLETPVTLKLKIATEANLKLTGVYFIGDNGELEFIAGKLQDGFLEVQIDRFGTYAVLEFDKSFDDVNASHWALSAIKQLAAQHVLSGVSETAFAPNQQVTRAEFAAFLTRKLGLTARADSTFTDVSPTKWYSDAVTAAFEAGIIQGRSDRTFAPDEQVTRQEMAAMLMKAYEFLSGVPLDEVQSAGFNDSDLISDWAINYVNGAHYLGFINGKGDNKFAPQTSATRAEAAQLIAKL
ncbi:S-layer homology domain-containing protein [Paenibacillus nasutitermitis]|uniref:S-layer homology domain-containing protein n=1 Tax=Paenibacillus nasutitermitis TaxID=1652958 RepID=A0A916ZG78_9BACL|nr:S-layer homology domain-containing protein [Paenibacillus nasutitermitis]GGD95837.1 hypothetical protein GCM10010911_63100 [Paenibacillus nasutitermitis]